MIVPPGYPKTTSTPSSARASSMSCDPVLSVAAADIKLPRKNQKPPPGSARGLCVSVFQLPYTRQPQPIPTGRLIRTTRIRDWQEIIRSTDLNRLPAPLSTRRGLEEDGLAFPLQLDIEAIPAFPIGGGEQRRAAFLVDGGQNSVLRVLAGAIGEVNAGDEPLEQSAGEHAHVDVRSLSVN